MQQHLDIKCARVDFGDALADDERDRSARGSNVRCKINTEHSRTPLLLRRALQTAPLTATSGRQHVRTYNNNNIQSKLNTMLLL